ncbi:bacterioferritin comigratory protein [Leptospira interrogans serovar Copenhageni str. LT2050]|nr:bacterioferritin comigratory protein [Leptospira interrogans serovar Copenhageni str. LT2050]
MGIVRTTFLIGADGKILKVYPKVSVKGHVDEILSDIKTLEKK